MPRWVELSTIGRQVSGDPTSGDLSLGELQSLCMKATKGAGRAVGVAEDAGRAVRWLSARGHDGAGALVALLRATDGKPARVLIPDPDTFMPVQDAICPLMVGGYLSDTGVVPDRPIGPIWAPILTVPFVAELGVDVLRDPSNAPQMVQLVPRSTPEDGPTHTRAAVSPDDMRILLALAARTYAPATDESRANGAGAGLADND